MSAIFKSLVPRIDLSQLHDTLSMQWVNCLAIATCTTEVSLTGNYERLEFLGDAWLKYVAVATVYQRCAIAKYMTALCYSITSV